ncbi:MAG: hypothetical protein WAX07_05620 [Candidatus Altiarchaeia archaeon]
MDETTCSICGQKMECPASTKTAKKHVCEYCVRVTMPDMDEQEIKTISLEERRLSKYFPDVEFLHNYVCDLSAPLMRASEKYLKGMSKKDILEESFHGGIRASLEFMLRQSDPEAIRKTRQKIEGEMRETLKESGADEKKIEVLMKAFGSSDEEIIENLEAFGITPALEKIKDSEEFSGKTKKRKKNKHPKER